MLKCFATVVPAHQLQGTGSTLKIQLLRIRRRRAYLKTTPGPALPHGDSMYSMDK